MKPQELLATWFELSKFVRKPQKLCAFRPEFQSFYGNANNIGLFDIIFTKFDVKPQKLWALCLNFKVFKETLITSGYLT